MGIIRHYSLFFAINILVCKSLGAVIDLTSVTSSGQQQVPAIAFSAARRDHLDATNGDITVIYDNVYLNEGNGYNPQSGHFVAPVAGIYMFLVHSLSEQNRAVGLDLYHNSLQINYFAYAYVPGGLGTGSNSITLKLAKGDNVFVKLKSQHALHNHANEHHSTFTGYILFLSPEDKKITDNHIVVG